MGRKLPKTLTADEQTRLLAQPNRRYLSPHRDWMLMRVMLETGLRIAEAVSLKPEHVDLDTARIMVREGKGSKDRVVWFGDDLRDALTEWMHRRVASAYLFPTSKGTKLATAHVRRSVKRYARAAGIAEADRVSPHTLRHTFATDLLREEKNVRLVQKALGHADLSTTMLYTHIVDADLEDAMRRFRQAA